MLGKILLVSVFALGAAVALANETSHQGEVKDNGKPANRYSGSAPVDLSRGLPFNNGTWGHPNGTYEAKAQAGFLAPGVRATPYSYEEQGEFVDHVQALYPIYEEAVRNLKTNKDERAEVKAYREEMLKNLQERLEASKSATKKAGSANENEWPSAQENARKAFGDLQALLVRNNTHY